MKKKLSLKFSDAEFITSALENKTFPIFKNKHQNPYPEIVIAGKSNVGKSSLINHLLNNKKLAFVSKKPGKTQTINFFKIDDEIILVDLPGYGFAKRSKDIKTSWAKSINSFLSQRTSIKSILLLIDSRRELSEQDLLLYGFANYKNIPVVLIMTKCDKLKPYELKKNLENIEKTISDNNLKPPIIEISYSVKDNLGKKNLISNLQKHYEELFLWEC